jgi:adenylosuccinate synthase
VTGGVDTLVVTHIDVLSRLKTWNYCLGYKGYHSLSNAFFDSNISDDILASFCLPHFLSLAQRAQFTQALSTVMPVLETCVVDEERVIQKIESLIGQSVGIISSGPSAENVQILNSTIPVI